jgi:hypothetical protein
MRLAQTRSNPVTGAIEGTRQPAAGVRLLPWAFVVGVLLLLAWANLVSGEAGSHAFEEDFFAEFEPSRGWPLRSWTRGTEPGTRLVDASVVMADIYRRDVFRGSAFPHLFVQGVNAAVDGAVAACLLFAAFFAGRRIRSRFASDASADRRDEEPHVTDGTDRAEP